MNRHSFTFATLFLFSTLACDDDTEMPNMPADSGTAPDGGAVIDGGPGQTDAGLIDGGPPPTVQFQIRIENISQHSALPTNLSSGVWATHGEITPFFAPEEVDRGEGLKALAEDGDPSAFAMSLANHPMVDASEIFNNATGTPADGAEPAAGFARPGQAFEFTVSTNARRPYLSFASMLTESNDLFFSPGAGGIKLFDDQDRPLPVQDISSSIELWDLGTEANESPGSGRNQAPRQNNIGDGNPEGVVHLFNYSTRSLPLAMDILEISAEKTGDNSLRFTVSNVSSDKGALATSLSPVFWVSHSDAWTLFAEQSQASAGLARMVEDGILSDLESEHSAALGVGTARAESDKAGEGESYYFDVTTSMSQPLLSFIIAINECNDAFIALPPEGVRLLDDNGRLREADEIAAEINLRMIVWDAGTERNEPPGIGPTQVARQTGSNRGVADAVAQVRRYQDSVNDLQGPRIGGTVNLSIEGDFSGDFTVTLENTSDNSNFPSRLSPLVWLLHDGGTKVFANGSPATPQLESLAEDGNPDMLKGELNAMNNVSAGIIRSPDGAGGEGIEPGQRFVWTVRPTTMQRTFNFASMLANSNDTFLALGPTGIALLDSGGQQRSNNDIAADIAANLAAYDAGTEGNQSGGGGPDQGAHQLTQGRGPSEGNGLVRKYSNSVWSYPRTQNLVKVTVTPVN